MDTLDVHSQTRSSSGLCAPDCVNSVLKLRKVIVVTDETNMRTEVRKCRGWDMICQISDI